MNPTVRIAFQIFHGVLALSLLGTGLMSLSHSIQSLHEPGHGHLAFVACLQVTGALLLLIPRTIRWGGGALLLVLIPGFFNELVHGDWELSLLVYSAGVWLVAAHGAAWSSAAPGGAIAASE